LAAVTDLSSAWIDPALLAAILRRIDRLRGPPVPAS
jgi:hypothetical protein